MKSTLTVTALLTLSVAGATFFSRTSLAAPPVNSENSPAMTPRPTSDQVDPTTAAAVRSQLADIVNNAATTNGFSDLVGDLAKPDRDHIGSAQPNNTSTLNARIEEFRKDFHDKYKQDFNIKNTNFDDLRVYRGADKDHASITLLSLKNMQPANPNAQPAPGSNTPLVGNPRGDDKHPDKVIVTEVKPSGAVADTKIPADQIRNPDLSIQSNPGEFPKIVATGNTNRIGGNMQSYQQNIAMAAPIQLNLVNEDPMGSQWRLESSNTLTAQSLCDSLAKHIKTLCDNRNAWPSDVNQAYRTVSGHVFQALQEVPAANISSEK